MWNIRAYFPRGSTPGVGKGKDSGPFVKRGRKYNCSAKATRLDSEGEGAINQKEEIERGEDNKSERQVDEEGVKKGEERKGWHNNRGNTNLTSGEYPGEKTVLGEKREKGSVGERENGRKRRLGEKCH